MAPSTRHRRLPLRLRILRLLGLWEPAPRPQRIN
ncbi:hypothetical protein BH20ACT8_BH20ACT8_01030 [soil metagenome]|jgi:hypothetical protein